MPDRAVDKVERQRAPGRRGVPFLFRENQENDENWPSATIAHGQVNRMITGVRPSSALGTSDNFTIFEGRGVGVRRRSTEPVPSSTYFDRHVAMRERHPGVYVTLCRWMLTACSCKLSKDLERRTTATDEYEVLMSAALLRKLLLDGDTADRAG